MGSIGTPRSQEQQLQNAKQTCIRFCNLNKLIPTAKGYQRIRIDNVDGVSVILGVKRNSEEITNNPDDYTFVVMSKDSNDAKAKLLKPDEADQIITKVILDPRFVTNSRKRKTETGDCLYCDFGDSEPSIGFEADPVLRELVESTTAKTATTLPEPDFAGLEAAAATTRATTRASQELILAALMQEQPNREPLAIVKGRSIDWDNA